MMIVAKGAPETFVPWGCTNDGAHIGQARTSSHPRLRVNPIPKRKNFARQGLRSYQLQGSWYGISVGKLDTRGQADTARHRRQKEPAVHVDHRMVEDSIGLWPEMHVVSAFDDQRNAIA
jgi:hypothetical protein